MKIKLKLSQDSIGDAIREIEKYRDDVKEKTELVRKRVAGILENMVRKGFNGPLYNDVLWEGKKVPDVEVKVDHGDKVSVVMALGKEAVFVEFGAGVYYNGPVGSYPHPDTPPGIVAIGTYGHGYGAREVWGYYDESGELKLTHGTPASMPMYFAAKIIAEEIPKIAKEVFGGGGR